MLITAPALERLSDKRAFGHDIDIEFQKGVKRDFENRYQLVVSRCCSTKPNKGVSLATRHQTNHEARGFLPSRSPNER
jgi:hypothetical protein